MSWEIHWWLWALLTAPLWICITLDWQMSIWILFPLTVVTALWGALTIIVTVVSHPHRILIRNLLKGFSTGEYREGDHLAAKNMVEKLRMIVIRYREAAASQKSLWLHYRLWKARVEFDQAVREVEAHGVPASRHIVKPNLAGVGRHQAGNRAAANDT